VALRAQRRDHLLDAEVTAGQVRGVRVAQFEGAGPKRGRDVRLGRLEACERRVHVARPAQVHDPVAEAQTDAHEGVRDGLAVLAAIEPAARVLAASDRDCGRSSPQSHPSPTHRPLGPGHKSIGISSILEAHRRASPPSATGLPRATVCPRG
jgi:hypothetical protein